MRDVIVAGAFPPPVTGMSKNNEIIAADLARLARVRRVDLSPRTLTRSPGYHLARVLKALRGCLTIARNGWRRDPFLYIAADGGWGLAYTAALVLTARVFRHGVCVHHRSFATTDHPSWLIPAVLALARRGSVPMPATRPPRTPARGRRPFLSRSACSATSAATRASMFSST